MDQYANTAAVGVRARFGRTRPDRTSLKTILTEMASLLACAMAGSAQAAPLISDTFETDTSGNYTLVEQGGPDSTASFGFDYISAGIPLAPHSNAGDRGGLRMTANDSLGATNAITAFYNTPITGMASYSLLVDVYLGVTGALGEGTTEHAHVGIAGDGATPNQLFAPTSGSGHFVAFDGDAGSSSDYRHYTPSSGLISSGDASYLNSTNTTNATGDTYQGLFPSPPYDFPGSPGNAWTTLRIDVVGGIGGTITYSLDGATGTTPIIRDTLDAVDGYVSLGYADLFTSVADPFQAQFVIYDNLRVVPAPGTAMLLGVGGVLMNRRRRRP